MRLLKSTAIIGSLTLVSRLLGLVREVLIARFLGAGIVSDAFFTAFKLPNVFRRMFAEGAFNAAFVPLYARRIEEEGEVAADEFAKEAMAALFVCVAAVVILFEVTMPWSLSLIGYGLERAIDPVTGLSPYYLAVIYAQITMPYLLFMSLAALFSGILNTRNHFALAAAIPILLNIFMISALFAGGAAGWDQKTIGYGLSIAVALSGIAQMGAVIWGCKKIGVRIGFRRPRLTPGVKRLAILVPKLVIASHNAGKLREIDDLLRPYGIQTLGAPELGLDEPEETEDSFAGNALLKALAAARAANLPALSDDSGLAVEALNGAPGIYSARWAQRPENLGGGRDFDFAMARVNQALGDNPNRTAKFICALCLAFPNGDYQVFEGEVKGDLIWPPRGDQGFGYDAIFQAKGDDLSFAQITPQEKHAKSHRADAFAKFLRSQYFNAA